MRTSRNLRLATGPSAAAGVKGLVNIWAILISPDCDRLSYLTAVGWARGAGGAACALPAALL